jgi:hypothetical protein
MRGVIVRVAGAEVLCEKFGADVGGAVLVAGDVELVGVCLEEFRPIPVVARGGPWGFARAFGESAGFGLVENVEAVLEPEPPIDSKVRIVIVDGCGWRCGPGLVLQNRRQRLLEVVPLLGEAVEEHFAFADFSENTEPIFLPVRSGVQWCSLFLESSVANGAFSSSAMRWFRASAMRSARVCVCPRTSPWENQDFTAVQKLLSCFSTWKVFESFSHFTE